VSVTRKSLLALSLSALCVALVVTPAGAAVKDEIAARLQPAGVSCVFGEACAAGLKVPGAENLAPRSGEEVYGTFCQACHASGANNAPLFANAEAWAPRIAKGIDGFNNGAMPVRGTCVNCSDDEIKAAVDHMVAAAEPK
jgi:cytochrome c5